MKILMNISISMTAGSLLAFAVHAQPASDFPNKPVEMIVPYSTGGGVSAMARAFSLEAAQELGQQLVLIHRDGAGGVVGFSALARAKPDGYTIAFSPASPLTNAPFINANMPYRNEQFEPVCQIFENVFAVAVRPDSPLRSFEDLVTRAKASPGSIAYGHAGPASVGHLSLATVERAAKIKLNAIAYKGDSQALSDTLAGTLDFSALGVGTLTGKPVRVLAVLSQKRHPAMPDVPSITELGYPANSQGLNGLFVPAGTPRAIVDRYASLCLKVSTSPTFMERARGMSQVVSYLGSREFKTVIDNTFKAHQSLVPSLNLEKN
jgi:tripartite-type tricarboxylate transporter receptor subunit TctC